MKLRRRPLSVYNASPPNSNSQNSLSDQPSRKRQRQISNQSLSDHERNDSDIENHSSILTSDDDDDRSSGIQTRSIAAAKRRNNQSSDTGMLFTKNLMRCSIEYLESEEEEEDEETNESESEEEEEPVIKHPKTRMVTRQMSLVMNHQIKIKTNVKVQPFVDHTEDTLRYKKQNLFFLLI